MSQIRASRAIIRRTSRTTNTSDGPRTQPTYLIILARAPPAIRRSSSAFSSKNTDMSSLGSRGRHRSRCRATSRSADSLPTATSRRSSSVGDSVNFDAEVDIERGPAYIALPPALDKRPHISIQYVKRRGNFQEDVTKLISHLCVSGWPTTDLTWKKVPEAHKRLVWEQFQIKISDEGDHEEPNWVDVYLFLRQNIPDAQKIVQTYQEKMEAKYPPGTERPNIDRELWIEATRNKYGYVKALGHFKKKCYLESSSSLTTIDDESASRLIDSSIRQPRLLGKLEDEMRKLREIKDEDTTDGVHSAAEIQNKRQMG